MTCDYVERPAAAAACTTAAATLLYVFHGLMTSFALDLALAAR